MIFDRVSDVAWTDAFLRLKGFLPHAQVLVKLESFNAAGSIKLKPAKAMIDDLERRGLIGAGSKIIESSSANLGIALAIVCGERGYEFECVCDPNSLPHNRQLIQAFGAQVHLISTTDANGGYLQSRIDFITRRLAEDPKLVWPNQYANPANPVAHYTGTAVEILDAVPDVHAIFVGVGSSGTLIGLMDRLAERAPHVRLVAVDVQGSVTFGLPSGRRVIPGLGASRRPELFQPDPSVERVIVCEEETVRMNHKLLRDWGFLAGGSTGSVLSAIQQMGRDIPRGAKVVAVSADLGERYLGTLYDDGWLAANLPGAIRPPLTEAA